MAYVRPFPGPGGKWQVSTTPADDVMWSRARRELLYATSPDLKVMVVPFLADGESFRAEKPRPWSDLHFAPRPRAPSTNLALHPDGERFAVAASSLTTTSKLHNVVLFSGFFEELRRATATKSSR